RWQNNSQRVRAAMHGDRPGFHGSGVALSASPIVVRIAVQNLSPKPPVRHAHMIGGVGCGGEVTDDEYGGLRSPAPADEAESGEHGVIAVHPFEAGGIKVELVQARFRSVEPVEILHPFLDASVLLIFEQVPIQALFVVPLSPLAE